jgi:hypothetical protein
VLLNLNVENKCYSLKSLTVMNNLSGNKFMFSDNGYNLFNIILILNTL